MGERGNNRGRNGNEVDRRACPRENGGRLSYVVSRDCHALMNQDLQ